MLNKDFNEEEWAEPKEGTKWPKEKRREYLYRVATEIGLYNANKKDLARKMGVSRRMLYFDIAALSKAGLDKNEVQYAKINMGGAYIKAIKEMYKILATGTKEEQIKAAKALVEATKGYTEHLEKFGLKEIVSPTTDSSLTIKWGKKDGDS